jgi:hypothetical protein
MEMELYGLGGLDCSEDYNAWSPVFSESCFDKMEAGLGFFDEAALDAHPSFVSPAKPCLLLDILGTEETWQGKHYYLITLGGRTRGMLNLVQWPMVRVVSECSTPQLQQLAMTCRSLRKVALQILEGRAHDAIRRKYFTETQLIKFIDAFGCFGWAMSLTNWLTPRSVQEWREEELDAAYEELVVQIDIDEVAPLHGLMPQAARRWKVEGRGALQRFMRECVSGRPSYCKMLVHYDRAWGAIRNILELNANLVRTSSFAGQHSVVRHIHASWPFVKVDVEVLAAVHVCIPDYHVQEGLQPGLQPGLQQGLQPGLQQGVCKWSIHDVYHWFRLKKLPVSGLLQMQVDGAELLRIFDSEDRPYAHNRITAAPPQGLGMNALQKDRFRSQVQKMLTQAEITFRLGEQKAS